MSSDSYLPMLLAQMQQDMATLRQTVTELTERVKSLEIELYSEGEEDGEHGTYMDGSPIQ